MCFLHFLLRFSCIVLVYAPSASVFKVSGRTKRETHKGGTTSKEAAPRRRMSNWKATLEFEVNIEYVGWIIFNIDGTLYLDSVVGKDSHTTMIDGLQVTGCGVGGIESEVKMIGDPET
ncbi:unnamed protein product [Cuscuta campestris]|uniref:Aconitase/3-isopropylmalate dehydratase large subunit alpha/beta/alpha domain-containing protein n=1 Tax=Cuscuta campestris TaxID=132261 RepID=A0A484LBJ9_9ASTE|nr:unnamed protein product [Cuscuta campestris]